MSGGDERLLPTITNGSAGAAASGTAPFPYWDIYIPLGIAGTLLNLLVILIVAVRKVIPGAIPRRLLINMCLSQMLCTSLNALKWIIGERYAVPANVFGTVLCRLWYAGFVFWSMVQASLENLMLFTVERYMSVLHPVKHRIVFSSRSTFVLVAMSWLLAFGIELGTMFETEREGTGCVHKRLNQATYNVWGTLIFLTFIVPLLVMLFCYGRMIHFLRTQSTARRRSKNTARDQVTRELTVTVVIAGFIYLICFAPNSIAYYLYTLGVVQLDFTGWYFSLTEFLTNFNFVLNPFIYALMLRPIRRALVALFSCCRHYPSQNYESGRARAAAVAATTTTTNCASAVSGTELLSLTLTRQNDYDVQ